MMKIANFIAFIIFIFLLTSCFKQDEKIMPHDPGNVKTQTIELTKDYRYQVYFDLSSEKILSTNLKTDWDLGFECSAKGWHIILNTSNFMVAAKQDIPISASPSIQPDISGISTFPQETPIPLQLAIGLSFIHRIL